MVNIDTVSKYSYSTCLDVPLERMEQVSASR